MLSTDKVLFVSLCSVIIFTLSVVAIATVIDLFQYVKHYMLTRDFDRTHICGNKHESDERVNLAGMDQIKKNILKKFNSCNQEVKKHFTNLHFSKKLSEDMNNLFDEVKKSCIDKYITALSQPKKVYSVDAEGPKMGTPVTYKQISDLFAVRLQRALNAYRSFSPYDILEKWCEGGFYYVERLEPHMRKPLSDLAAILKELDGYANCIGNTIFTIPLIAPPVLAFASPALAFASPALAFASPALAFASPATASDCGV